MCPSRCLPGCLPSLQALPYIVGMSAVAALGQFFIAHTIRSFWALAYATIVTTRQFASPLLSCIATARPLTEGGLLAG